MIILTRDLKEGQRLKNSLVNFDYKFNNIECLTKDDIYASPGKAVAVDFIYSTWYMPVFSEDEIKKYFPSLKAIFYAAGTVKYFAEPFLKNGIKVYSAANANGITVAEFVVAQIILANKGFFQAQKEYKKPFWRHSFKKARSFSEVKSGNFNAKIGIVGCGSVGRQVVRILKSYKYDLYIFDPYLSDEFISDLGAKRASFEEIISSCDVISNHLPDIQSTNGIFNYSTLSKMKNNATFINTGRGKQIVEKDLAKVMQNKPNACALLDVTIHEPLYPWSPLLRRKNIFISPHIAGSLSGEFERMVEYMILASQDFSEGKNNDCEVNLKKLSIQA